MAKSQLLTLRLFGKGSMCFGEIYKAGKFEVKIDAEGKQEEDK